MPLVNGFSQESIHENIKRELGAGKSRKQAIAIAYSKAREAKKQKTDCEVLLNPGLNQPKRGKQGGEYFV